MQLWLCVDLGWLLWQVGSLASMCHVTFASSVNRVDYFLRDQNWLPEIRPSSIFSPTSRTRGGQGLQEAEAHGKRKRSFPPEYVTKQLEQVNLRLGCDCTDLSQNRKWMKLYPRSYIFLGSALSEEAHKLFLTTHDASTGSRITTWPSVPLLRYHTGPCRRVLVCVGWFLYHSLRLTVGWATRQALHKFISGHVFLTNHHFLTKTHTIDLHSMPLLSSRGSTPVSSWSNLQHNQTLCHKG